MASGFSAAELRDIGRRQSRSYGLPSEEALAGLAVKFLNDGNQQLTSSLLSQCRVEVFAYDTSQGNADYRRLGVTVRVFSNRTVYDILNDSDGEIRSQFEY